MGEIWNTSKRRKILTVHGISKCTHIQNFFTLVDRNFLQGETSRNILTLFTGAFKVQSQWRSYIGVSHDRNKKSDRLDNRTFMLWQPHLYTSYVARPIICAMWDPSHRVIWHSRCHIKCYTNAWTHEVTAVRSARKKKQSLRLAKRKPTWWINPYNQFILCPRLIAWVIHCMTLFCSAWTFNFTCKILSFELLDCFTVLSHSRRPFRSHRN